MDVNFGAKITQTPGFAARNITQPFPVKQYVLIHRVEIKLRNFVPQAMQLFLW